MHIVLKVVFLFLLLAPIKNGVGQEIDKPKFPFTLEEILKNKLVGASVEFCSQYPDSCEAILNMFCDTFNSDSNLFLEKCLLSIDSTTYAFFNASSDWSFPRVCYSGTFYFKVDDLQMIVQYDYDFVYSSDSLSSLITQLAEEKGLSISELLKFRQYEDSNFWIPKLLFFIEFDDCDDYTIFKINKAMTIIESALNELKSSSGECEIELSPRLFVRRSKF